MPRMECKASRWLLLLVAFIWMHCVLGQLPNLKDLKCSKANSTEVDLTALAGYWYEIVRFPNTNVLKCLNVSVPSTTIDDELRLDLEYIDTTASKARPVKETISFPWDEKTANGTFILNYPGMIGVTVTYKLLYTNGLVSIVCGSASISPIPTLKVLTRQRELSPTITQLINSQLDKLGIGNYVVWPEQRPDQCNAAPHLTAPVFTVLALVTLWSLYRWH